MIEIDLIQYKDFYINVFYIKEKMLFMAECQTIGVDTSGTSVHECVNQIKAEIDLFYEKCPKNYKELAAKIKSTCISYHGHCDGFDIDHRHLEIVVDNFIKTNKK